MIRKLDELGRIILPIEVRRALNISERDEFEITLSKEGQILLSKVDNFNCAVCGCKDDLNKIGDTGKYICCGCSEIIKNI